MSGVYDDCMSPNKSKRHSLTIGVAALTLQALATPFAISGALNAGSDQPSWLAGLFLALDLGSIASLAIIAFGLHTGRAAARFAPAVLVLPAWLFVAVTAPVVQPATAAVYAVCALLMGWACVGSFIRSGAEARFTGKVSRASSTVTTAAIPQA